MVIVQLWNAEKSMLKTILHMLTVNRNKNYNRNCLESPKWYLQLWSLCWMIRMYTFFFTFSSSLSFEVSKHFFTIFVKTLYMSLTFVLRNIVFGSMAFLFFEDTIGILFSVILDIFFLKFPLIVLYEIMNLYIFFLN